MNRVATLPLLGQRLYLHSSTLFEAMEPEIGDGREILFQVSRLIISDRVAISDIDPDGDERRKADAFFMWNAGGTRVCRGITALPPSKSPPREPYDEEAICDHAEFSPGHARLRQRPDVSCLKAIIALNKVLLSELLKPPQDGRQWLFTRIELDARPPADSLFELTYRSRFGLSAVKTDISFASGESGSIYFSWQALPQ